MMSESSRRDQAIWERIFASIPEEWYKAPPSDAMKRCRAYFQSHPCRHLLDWGCGFGRWARYLAGQGAREVIGIDYAEGGIRAAFQWARREKFPACFLVASAAELPFCGAAFDGVMAALLLDNLTREECQRVSGELARVVRLGARGFFVFNPLLTLEELAPLPEDNPSRDCTHTVYQDVELPACLPGWGVSRTETTLEGFRVLEAIFQPG